LEATVGDAKKETEFADYVVDDNTIGLQKAYQCPWRFGETLTFVGRMEDVLSPGMHILVKASSDFQFGPVQFQFAGASDLGEASIDIRRRALPACIGQQKPGKEVWESPVLVIPLSHVRGGKCGEGHGIGDAVAHVTLAFSVDMDPETILAAADYETRGVADVLGVSGLGVTNLMNWMDKPLDAGWLPQGLSSEDPGVENPFSTFLAPSDLSPDGWTSWTAPNGRKFWHHRALGPAPWEQANLPPSAPAGLKANQNCSPNVQRGHGNPAADDGKAGLRPATLPLSAKAKSFMEAPDLDPAGWISHKGPDGRLFWHNVSLGPAPWEVERQQQSKPHTMPCMKPSNSREAWAI